MGCFLGIVLAFGRESFDTSIGTIEGVEEFLKVPVLGIIPQFDHKVLRDMAQEALPPDTPSSVADGLSKLICLLDPKSVLSESLRSLRTNIQFASLDRRVKSIIFTSAGLGEGKSTCVINLAITMAQEGMKVLLVDADLRKPIVHQRRTRPRAGLGRCIAWDDLLASVCSLGHRSDAWDGRCRSVHEHAWAG